ncbi:MULTISPECIES: SpoVR family protein [unclassified Undibacterium]|uniref:SpoVR family protein n=1 Tax=unclassified Undibacterium TaxID=2630295 RepID=UPI002AC9640E|nr:MULTISPECIES: SpoVR family protein [unclassified Undibacterium]MEB0140278.1 SpoVR family protein [Undibacterium sp. CCC2.1]MEB0173308.1 SpoVR family protein [Undibacterium sp. CCC1.1]MEB0177127.1 SpoVR family protein [Undibacterium sp. CCC3.4]MEB0216417.1 SpoVR family protein [Undibacterium sp. 5I2]WPX45529.1 SpoVR family protein [Undibacterium sp. CCC3.4]
MKNTQPVPPVRHPRALPEQSEWTFDLIEQAHEEIRRVAENFGLDTYPNQLEIITAEQMMDAYASVGMPVSYNHWSFGKHFLSTEKSYKRGQMGLAYEIVINSNPCISYLMEENSLTMQALVIAHAAYGHNSFFKGNYLFRTWTDADAIIDYMVFAKNYIAQCEQRHGSVAVELILDSCHALQNYGVDRYKRPARISLLEERERQSERETYLQSQLNDLWRTLPRRTEVIATESEQRFPREPQENLLYFIEKYSPLLEPWQREIVRIIRKISQYFYPQRQTQVMNEGWATFWHYTILHQLYEEGIVGDGFMMEFLQSHTNVVFQPAVGSRYFNGINPYALGFAMMRDIRRICEQPTAEDRTWFPEIAGSDWKQTLQFAMRNFKDESFIAQYLSPKLIRDFHFFAILDDDSKAQLQVAAIHDESGYRTIRQQLAAQYNLGNREPAIEVWSVDMQGDRSLTLRHQQFQRRPLNSQTGTMLKHVARLWGFDIYLETVDQHNKLLARQECKWEKHSR